MGQSKTHFRNRKSRTHFQQIPIEAVKKIVAAEIAEKENTQITSSAVATPCRRTEPFRALPLRGRQRGCRNGRLN